MNEIMSVSVEFLGERYCGNSQMLGICAALQVLRKHGLMQGTPCILLVLGIQPQPPYHATGTGCALAATQNPT